MNTKKLLGLLFILASTLTIKSQTTSLITYKGGYFVKNDTLWEEHRPTDKAGIWSAYTQTRENDNFYYIENSKCNLAIPKNKNNHIYIMRSGEWAKIYNTIDIYNYYPEKNSNLYCYDGGYFVRDNDIWREYRPKNKYNLWAGYQQVEEQDHFFIIENDKNRVAIPKRGKDIFVMRNNKWQVCYKNTIIYDTSSTYDFNFYFTKYQTATHDSIAQENNSSARLSFDRKGNVQINYGDKQHTLNFDNICTLHKKGSNTPIGIELKIDNNKKISLIGSEICAIDLPGVCPYINLVGCENNNNSDISYIIELIENHYFYLAK